MFFLTLPSLGGEGGASEGAGSDQDDNKEEKVEDLLSTKKPAILPLSEEQTVMQIDCGTFHTGIEKCIH